MIRSLLFFCAVMMGVSGTAQAHFGMVIPSTSAVLEKKDASVNLTVAFAHPMEMNGMNMALPKSFVVYSDGKAEDLKGTLKATKIIGHDGWAAQYVIKRPGVYQFAMEPAPYWEPAEDKYIIHYTKTVVAAFGEEEGWDKPVGLKTEIVPLTRPFGNYAGNVFQGQVLLDGKPVAGASVEVELYNKAGKYKAPNDYAVTQVVKTDANGVFTYGVPFAGWWGFSAISAAAEKLNHDGSPKDVELGAVLWVEFVDPLHK